jgi:hypothetical protein
MFSTTSSMKAMWIFTGEVNEEHIFRLFYFPLFLWSWDSIVGTVTGHGLDDGRVGFRVLVGSKIFSSHHPDRLWGPPSLQSNGYWGFFPRPGHGVDHSPPPSADVKKIWIYTSIPPYAFMA